MCTSCSSKRSQEKFQKLSANFCALDSRAAVYEQVNGNHVDLSVKTFPVDMKNT